MHIHANMNIEAASLAAAASYRAENAERAAQTRRRLNKAAQTLDAATLGTSDPDTGLMVSEWLNAHHDDSPAEDTYTQGS